MNDTEAPPEHPPMGGIHEAALYVEDLDRAEAFWRALGLSFISRAEGRHVFFRAGRDMLLLFVADATLQPDSDVPPHGASGPAHVAFDVPHEDALDAWRERLADAGVAVEAELDWPTGASSIYFRDSDGNSIELIVRGAWGE